MGTCGVHCQLENPEKPVLLRQEKVAKLPGTTGTAEILNEIYHATFRELQYLAHSGSAAAKLARFLLDAAASRGPSNDQLRARLTLTHEEIAEIIGVTRETVTRLFASFKREHLIELQGSILVIADKAGLERLLRA